MNFGPDRLILKGTASGSVCPQIEKAKASLRALETTGLMTVAAAGGEMKKSLSTSPPLARVDSNASLG